LIPDGITGIQIPAGPRGSAGIFVLCGSARFVVSRESFDIAVQFYAFMPVHWWVK